MVWEGKDVIAGGRKLLGATKPSESAPGTIRGDLAIDVGRNICHGSDLPESAAAEIAAWFPEGVNVSASSPQAPTVHVCRPPHRSCLTPYPYPPSQAWASHSAAWIYE
jgi:hypothetical protein